MFSCENKFIFPMYVSDQKCENQMDLLLIIDENKSHYKCIPKILTIYVAQNKKYFCESCLQCFSSKYMLTERKKVWSTVCKIRKKTIEFKNYFKQVPVPADYYDYYVYFIEC